MADVYFEIPTDLDGKRLDAALAALAGQAFSRTRLGQLIRDGGLTHLPDGTPCLDPSRRVRPQEAFRLAVPDPEPDTLIPEAIPLAVVYEDAHLLVIDKPAGLVVHPGAGHGRGTLVQALLHHCGGSLSGIGGVQRPGIVHRLDRDTSGLMIAAKTDAAHRALAAQLADRSLKRTYQAIVMGAPVPRAGEIDLSIGRHPSDRLRMAAGVKGGRAALTRYRVLEEYGAASRVECRLDTGRTHQIRVHMAHLRHPVIGDPLYGPAKTALAAALRRAEYPPEAVEYALAFPRQALHACAIGFVHPESGERLAFDSSFPEDIAQLVQNLKIK